jgi:hypothetical protein
MYVFKVFVRYWNIYYFLLLYNMNFFAYFAYSSAQTRMNIDQLKNAFKQKQKPTKAKTIYKNIYKGLKCL